VDCATVQAFARLLVGQGFRAFHLAFGDGNRSCAKWRRFAGSAGAPLRTLIDLFLLQSIVDADQVIAVTGRTIYDELLADRILVQVRDGVCTPGLILISFRSLLFFHELTPRPGIYFGNDSIALGIYQTPSFAGVTLDLCSGTAIQAMISAQHGAKAYAVEINPKAAHVARFNLRLNALADKVELVNCSLEDFAESLQARLDLVTFNPPLLPVPEVLDYPFVGDGGADGLDVTRRALELYLPHLAPGGAIEFIGCGLGRGRTPVFVDDLAAILRRHGAHGQALLAGRWELRRGDPGYDSLVGTAAMNSKITVDLADAVYEQHFQKLGADSIYTFFMRGERPRDGEGPWPPPVAIIDVSEGGMNWFQ
jgi:release factor glutamine methyltransferase